MLNSQKNKEMTEWVQFIIEKPLPCSKCGRWISLLNVRYADLKTMEINFSKIERYCVNCIKEHKRLVKLIREGKIDSIKY